MATCGFDIVQRDTSAPPARPEVPGRAAGPPPAWRRRHGGVVQVKYTDQGGRFEPGRPRECTAFDPGGQARAALPSLDRIKREKGVWWMPWQQEAMKDVLLCDKLRGAEKRLRSADFRMGQPT